MAKKPPKIRIEANDSPRINQGLAGLAALKNDSPTQAEPAPPSATVAPPKNARWTFGPKVVLQRELKGRGGKTVLRVRGLELDKKGLLGFSKYLKKSLGCGALVEESDLLLLGDVGERARELLLKQGARKVVLGN